MRMHFLDKQIWGSFLCIYACAPCGVWCLSKGGYRGGEKHHATTDSRCTYYFVCFLWQFINIITIVLILHRELDTCHLCQFLGPRLQNTCWSFPCSWHNDLLFLPYSVSNCRLVLLIICSLVPNKSFFVVFIPGSFMTDLWNLRILCLPG